MTRGFASLPLAACIACSTAPTTSLRTIDPGLMVGRSAEPAPFERRDDPEVAEPIDPEKHQKARTATFWTGVVLAAVGGAGTIAFAATGRAFESKLARGYETSMTRAEEERYQNRGELMNGLAVGSGAVGLVGLLTAAVALGVDYTLCGKLAKRRKGCSR
jgi:hypothetical protein